MLLKCIIRLDRRLAVLLAALLIASLWAAEVFADSRIKLTIKVLVTDDKGKAVPGAKVSIPRPGETNARGEPLSAIEGTTNANGMFLPEGPPNVFVLGENEHKVIISSGSTKLSEKVLSNKELEEAASKRGEFVISISLNGQHESQALSVSGKVTDEQGRPVGDAQISLISTQKEIVVAKTTSAADGKYELKSQLPIDGGNLYLAISASGFKLWKQDLKSAQPASAQIIDPTLKSEGSGTGDDLKGFYLWATVLFVLGLLLGVGGAKFYNYLRGHGLHNEPLSAAAIELRGFSTALDGIKHSMLTKADLGRELGSLLENARQEWLAAQANAGKAASSGSSSQGHGSGSAATNPAGGSALEVTAERTERGNPHTQNSEAAALNAYHRLMNRQPVVPEPIYLDVEGPRSAAGKIEDSNVYLSELSSSRGALVLFAEAGSTAGWVFPNPKVALRFVAIKDVFPELSERDYQLHKDSVYPKYVRKIEERRWLVTRR